MKKLLFLAIIISFIPLGISEARNGGEVSHFFVEPSYDLENREELGGELVKETEMLDFYIDKSWWTERSSSDKSELEDSLETLSEEFSENIYPQMTDRFGDTPDHPVDKSKKVSILIHPMKERAGGYFNSGDQYSKYQNTRSNERTLLYLNTKVLNYEDKGGFLAHEFMHLLVFNQKERLRGVREEIWLNEARAEFIPTLLGYDEMENSNLDRRINTFLRDPDISLTEWIGQKADYGVVNIFTQYMVDHYGMDVLIESLNHGEVGIESLNYALEELDYDKDFHDVFNDFKVAVLVNDCELGERYCFNSEDLKNLQVSPATNYMPYSEDSNLSVQYRTKNWAGNWHRITGGSGTLELEFKMEKPLRVEVPYLLCSPEGDCEVDFMETENGEGFLEVEGFNDEYESLTIMPSVQAKTSGFNGAEDSFLFSWEARVIPENSHEETLEKLNRLRELLEILQQKIQEEESKIQEEESKPSTCTINGPLYRGATDSQSIECLQRFLSTKPDVYPEGYITGNFGPLTEAAVSRLQERYAEEVLHPLGLEEGTGYLGVRTISKINSLR